MIWARLARGRGGPSHVKQNDRGRSGHLGHQKAPRSDRHLGHGAGETLHMPYSHLDRHNKTINVQMNV